MRKFSADKYPNLARLDRILAKFFREAKKKKLSWQEREEGACHIHPVYWMETYGHVLKGELGQETGGGAVTEAEEVPFILKPTQLIIADKLCANLLPGKWKRTKVVVLKCRKAGISTLFAAFDYWFMRFVPNIGAFVIADKGAHTANIFDMVVRFHRRDKCSGRPNRMPMSRNKSGLKLSNGAMLEMDSGETKQPATSQTIQICHMSENSKWTQSEDAETSLHNSIPRTGFSWIVKESTAFGINKFKEDCESAQSPKSEWIFVFVPWYDLEDCVVPLKDEEKLEYTMEEKELVALYSLTPEQIKFRRERIKDIGESKFKQDFPMNEREPFLTSVRSYFWIEKIQDRIEEIDFRQAVEEDGLEKALASKKFPTIELFFDSHKEDKEARSKFLRAFLDRTPLPRKAQISEVDGKATYKFNPQIKRDEGAVWMWRPPAPRRKYVVSVDPAEGISSDGYTSDLSVVEVFDCFKREQAAELAGIYDEEIIARYAVLLAKLYGNAMVVVEVNAKAGGLVLEKMKKFQYYHLYHTQKLSRGQIISTTPGWRTTRGNKQEVCSQLKLDFKNEACILHSRDLLTEMLAFVEDKTKLRASRGNTDDRVIASSIALTVIEQTPGLQGMRTEDALYEIARGVSSGRSSLPWDVEPLAVPLPNKNPRQREIRLNRYNSGVQLHHAR